MKKKKKFYDLPIIIVVVELLIFNVGLTLIYFIGYQFTLLSAGMQDPVKEFVDTAAMLSAFLIPSMMCLLYVRITKKERLKYLRRSLN